jgi:hypothetical protein
MISRPFSGLVFGAVYIYREHRESGCEWEMVCDAGALVRFV